MAHIEEPEAALPRSNELVIALIRIGRVFQDLTFIREDDRRKVRDPRTFVQKMPLFGSVLCNILRHLRARPDETHVAFEHVPELRQFIELEPAYESTEDRYPSIARRR